MNKIYIVRTITTNDMEPSHYSSHKWEYIEGIYSSHESALAKMEELHDAYRLQEPFWEYVHQECTIIEHNLNP
jgi:hypothetical protein